MNQREKSALKVKDISSSQQGPEGFEFLSNTETCEKRSLG